ALPGRRRRRNALELETDRLRAREGDDGDVRMGGKGRADPRAVTGEELHHTGRHARGTQRLDQAPRRRRRLLRGLQDHGVAGDERGDRHPRRDGEREVPRRDDGGDALALVREAVPLPRRRLHEGARGAVQSQHLPPVVLAEVDRLAHVRIGLVPRLAALEDLERGDVDPPVAQPRRRTEQHRGATARRTSSSLHAALVATTRSWSPGSMLTIDRSVATSSPATTAGTARGALLPAASTATANVARPSARRHSVTGSGAYGAGAAASVIGRAGDDPSTGRGVSGGASSRSSSAR